MQLRDLADYFLSPKKSGYDVPKTISYSIVLIGAAYVVFRILKKLKIKIDERLALVVSPYIIFGAALRVIQDTGIVDSYFFITPGIYALVFSILFASLLLSLAISRKFKVPYYKTAFVLGLAFLPFVFSYIKIINIYGAALVIIFFLPWLVILKFISWNPQNKVVTLLHIFDATTTAVAMNFFGYYEQHVLPAFLIETFGPFSFIVFKIIIIISILEIIDHSLKEDPSIDREFVIYLKLIIGILGAATGTRDFITLLAGI